MIKNQETELFQRSMGDRKIGEFISKDTTTPEKQNPKPKKRHVLPEIEETCAEHDNPLNIVCVDCRVKICSMCALFGRHKGHEVR